MLRAVEHIRPMKGGAQSHLLRADDGHYYVVKFQNNPQHRRVLANEYIAARLAQWLALPVPPCDLIEVPASLIAGSPELVLRVAGEVLRCSAGLQFASRLPCADPHAPIFDYLPDAGLDLVANLRDFAGMLCFDKWTCNCNGRQVIFCRPHPRRPMRVFMIDQGFCFNAGDWNFPDSPLRGVYSRNQVYQAVRGWDSFAPWLARIEQCPEEVIYSCGEHVPPEWYGSWDDLERLLRQLAQRRERLRDLLAAVRASVRNPFPQWRDDVPATVSLAAGAGD